MKYEKEAYCSAGDCGQLATHNDLTPLCDDHQADWELHDAEYHSFTAAKRLAETQKRYLDRKLKVSNEMTERIK